VKTGILARAFLLGLALALLVGLVRGDVESRLLIREADRYRAIKEYGRAINIYQQLVILHPQWALPHLRLGQMYLVQGRLNEAEGEFIRAWELDGEEEEALLGLGLVDHHRGDIEEALVCWHEAAALNPRNVEVHYRLGTTYLDRSQFELAEQELERVVLQDGGHQEAHYYLGLLLAAKDTTLASEHLSLVAAGKDPGLSERAQEMMLLLAEIAASQDEAYVAALLGHAYIKYEMPSLALVQLERVVAVQPDNHAARAYLGYALFALGEHEEARDVLREVTHVATKYPLGHYFLAMLHRSEGYLPTALWEFKRSLQRDPSNAAAYADIADTYQRMGLYLAAEEWYRAAVEVAPDEPSFRLLLAQFYVDVLLRAEEGLGAARRAVALAPDNPLAQDLLGWAHYLAGDLARAQVALEGAVSLDPDFARAYYHLGVVYAQLGDDEKAQWAYGRAIDLDSDGLYRERAMAELDEE
jgi:tetratricopeptide (TPR) repeat protein